jgi:hypothetical protein
MWHFVDPPPTWMSRFIYKTSNYFHLLKKVLWFPANCSLKSNLQPNLTFGRISGQSKKSKSNWCCWFCFLLIFLLGLRSMSFFHLLAKKTSFSSSKDKILLFFFVIKTSSILNEWSGSGFFFQFAINYWLMFSGMPQIQSDFLHTTESIKNSSR